MNWEDTKEMHMEERASRAQSFAILTVLCLGGGEELNNRGLEQEVIRAQIKYNSHLLGPKHGIAQ